MMMDGREVPGGGGTSAYMVCEGRGNGSKRAWVSLAMSQYDITACLVVKSGWLVVSLLSWVVSHMHLARTHFLVPLPRHKLSVAFWVKLASGCPVGCLAVRKLEGWLILCMSQLGPALPVALLCTCSHRKFHPDPLQRPLLPNSS